ncbi:MAG: helix-turn-helix domain-containing protein [Anaerolineales bacterium]|nr:helix-turn-helix domain-containing protein [Anaerolineales bacterium]MCB8959738.1 helix-turn-helix domain-containing protein [Ardenticatenales bacterium]
MHTQTAGGQRLRTLRKYYGKTQLDVELEANLGTGYLQRVETGRVKQPEQYTLERILVALSASYNERRETLACFGYLVDAPIPDAGEIAWAINHCQAELDHAFFPAYLLDCAHRLLAWNRPAPHLWGDGATSASGVYASMLNLVFDTSSRFGQSIANPDAFLPAQIRALCYEWQWFQDEPWYKALLDEMMRLPRFHHYWTLMADELTPFPARPLTELIFAPPDEPRLTFRLVSERFVTDQRFRIIYLLPADTATTEQCWRWQAEAGASPQPGDDL